MVETISAQKARLNFGEMLNAVYYSDKEFVIEKKGKPLAVIAKYRARGRWEKKDTQKIFMKYAGILPWEEGERMKKLISLVQ